MEKKWIDIIEQCEMCDKWCVVREYAFNSTDGVHRICLNCGWIVTSDYCDDEELENLRENYETTIKEADMELSEIEKLAGYYEVN